MQPALVVPDTDRMGVVLVVRFRHESKPMTGGEGVVLQRVETVGHPGDLDHANALVLAAHDLTGRSIPQPKAGAAPLEPEPQALVRLSLGHASGP